MGVRSCSRAVQATDDTDWEQLHRDGKTSGPLIPTSVSVLNASSLIAAVCAGEYESSVLSQLVRLQCGTDRTARVLEIGMFVGASCISID